MPFDTDGSGYGIPNQGPMMGPSQTQQNTPIQDYPTDTGEFFIQLIHPPKVQVGATARFRAVFAHFKDGAISPTGLAVKWIDSDGSVVLASGITATAPAQDQGSTNTYFVSATFAANLPPGNYRIQWTGTYTPLGTSTALNVNTSKPFTVVALTPPSKYVFYDTSRYP
jgi:hypothetical protein